MPNPPPPSIEKSLSASLAALFVRWRAVLFAVTLVLFAGAWWKAQELSYDRSIESLYAADNPRLQDYRESKSLFGGDEFAIVAYTDPQLLEQESRELTPTARQRLEELTEKLNSISGVNAPSTQDLASLSARLFPVPVPFDLLRGILIGRDGQTTAVVLRLLPEQSTPIPRNETIARIRSVAEHFGNAHDLELHVVGEPVQVLDMYRYVEEDGHILFAASLALLGLVLLLLLRSLRWILLPMLVVVVAITWTEALAVVSGLRLSMVNSMLNSLVTITATATVIHVAVNFRDRAGQLAVPAFRSTLAELLPPITWTTLTTAAGFGALMSSSITPVLSFSLMMTVASVLVLVVVPLVVPTGALIGQPLDQVKPEAKPSRLSSWLSRTTDWTQRRRGRVLLAFAVVSLVCGLGFLRLQVETDFSKNFRESSPIVQGLLFVEDPQRLGGAGTWEVNFPAPQNLSNDDEDYLDAVADLSQRLRDQFTRSDGTGEITKVLSITDGLATVPKLPFFSDTVEKRLAALDRIQPEFRSSLYNSQAGRMRIMLRSPERQEADKKLDLIRRVRQAAQAWANERLAEDFDRPQVKATGLFVLLAHLIQSLLGDQLVSFLWAASSIGVMMLLAFRNVRQALIAVLPNLFPIVLVIGSMGLLGVPLNIATAMIASVSIGLTVDSSIHYTTAYRRARAAGQSQTEALRQTHTSVGLSLVYANLALIAGFTVLTLSHFVPLVYFGMLVSVAMLGGLAGNLMLLPVLLPWTDRQPRRNLQDGQ